MFQTKIFYCFLLFFWGVSPHLQARQVDIGALPPHPRLLLKKGEEEKIKVALERSPELQKVDNFIRLQAENMLDMTPLAYQKIGIRLLGVSRTALLRLYYWSYTYRMTGDKRFVVRADQELNAVCDFKDWNPSHFLDVGEMAMAVAIAYDWLYDELPQVTKDKVLHSLAVKAFKPSFNTKLAWFLQAENNWNSVCNAGLSLAAMAVLDKMPDTAQLIIDRAIQSVQKPLKAYAPSGNYPEGPSYWNYGTTYQMMLSAALMEVYGTDKGLSQSPGFMQSAYYMNFTLGASGNFFNYSDGGPVGGPSTSLFWFAAQEKNPSLVYQEMQLIRQGKYTDKINISEGRYLPNVLVFGKDLDLNEVKPLTEHIFSGHGVSPVVMVRTNWESNKGQYFGLKAGTASAPHAHQDQGSFVYDSEGVRWAMDFGMQNYESIESNGVNLWSMKQNSPRWSIFRYNNLNHNTISINHQLHNVAGFAPIIEVSEKPDFYSATVDLTPVLNLDNELKLAHRKLILVKDHYFQVMDSIITNNREAHIRWNMVTPAQAEIVDSKTIRLAQKGKELFLHFDADVPFKLVIRPSENPGQYVNETSGKNYADFNAKNPGTQMLGFDARVPANETAVFKVRFLKKP